MNYSLFEGVDGVNFITIPNLTEEQIEAFNQDSIRVTSIPKNADDLQMEAGMVQMIEHGQPLLPPPNL